ncbi:DUF305 domain-containing protein [Hymenobacter metallicola]|uniref:DUF305 domain-containing protein n=1 Tax=Hymenobacter metallicola TaxID=2563114 RepID=A0A4Z0QJ96_9BACT|nr:DUF305 domain-containing protein [Hymenobacter metallicola]TGE29353.1 DUF305 domain-containing protein [Hymenobacter metallicola]
MKASAFLLPFLTSGALLLSSCGDTKSADTTTTTPADAAVAAAADSTSSPHSGPDHHEMDHGGTRKTDMMAVMHTMMQEMDEFKPAGNADHDFAHMMMAHHQGAVEMAKLELEQGQDATLRALAEKITADQQREIKELETIATRLDGAPTNYQPKDPKDPFTQKMKASMDGMMKDMGTASGNVDQDFAALMIPHHQSAIDMAQAELAHGRDTKLKEMAQQMINAQQQEIKQLKTWQVKNGGKVPGSAAVYECSMGCAGSQSSKPGKCPVCGMDLVKKS